MKLYNLGKISDYNWIKNISLCNSIEESDIIYYSSNTLPYLNENFHLCKLSLNDKLILNIFNRYLNKKIIIGVKYGGLLLNHIYNGSISSVSYDSKLAKHTLCNGKSYYLCDNYKYHSYISNYVDFAFTIKAYRDFYYSYVPESSKSIIITFDPSITNRVPDSEVMLCLNQQIKFLYEKD